VKNDANGGFEQVNVQGKWREGQRFSLKPPINWRPTNPCTRFGDYSSNPRSVASIPNAEAHHVRFDIGKREQRVLYVKQPKTKEVKKT
jgi:hypothetical protein